MFRVCKECTHAQHCAIVEGHCPKQMAQWQHEQAGAPEWKFSEEQSRQIIENMMTNNAFFRKAAGIG